jgi:hypothetical protein
MYQCTIITLYVILWEKAREGVAVERFGDKHAQQSLYDILAINKGRTKLS